MKKWLSILLTVMSWSILAGEINTVFIKPKSVLINLEDNKDILFEKGFYAKVEETAPRSNVYYVYDKLMKRRYTVEGWDVLRIDDDLHPLPPLNANENQRPQNYFRKNDEAFPIEIQFNIHYDNFQLSELNEIYNDNITSVNSTRYELRSFYRSNLPIDFGLGLNYQSAYWQNDVESIRLSILSIGPQIRKIFMRKSDYEVSFHLGGELAPIYNGSSGGFIDQFSALLFDAGVETVWSTDWGKFSLGSHYRHHKIQLQKTTRTSPELSVKNYSLNSIGAMVGYKVDWDL